jgi:hypothetical protein
VRLVHRPTLARVAVLSAAWTLLLFAAVSLLAPTMVDLWGADTARTTVLVTGVAVRLLAGWVGARRAWGAGADVPLVLVTAAIGGVLGWLAFPGLLSVLGLVVGGDVGQGSSRLLVDLGTWAACVCVGALGARWPVRPMISRPTR